MNATLPSATLLAEAQRVGRDDFAWHFVLQSHDGSINLDVSEREPSAPLDRLELLAVVRGLEALDRPARVTLRTPSRTVIHGLRYGLPGWRESKWQWESFGQMTPIKHEDLWRRIDQALRFHTVNCKLYRADAAASHASVPEPAFVRRRRQQSQVVIAHRETIELENQPSAWFALRERLAGMLMGLGSAIAPAH
jgi:ribonuclease HI